LSLIIDILDNLGNWNREEIDSTRTLAFNKKELNGVWSFYIQIEDSPDPPPDLDDIAQRFVNDFKSKRSNLKVESYSDRLIGNKAAKTVLWFDNDGKQDEKVMQVFAIYQMRIFIFTYIAVPPEAYSVYLPLIQKVLSSVTFADREDWYIERRNPREDEERRTWQMMESQQAARIKHPEIVKMEQQLDQLRQQEQQLPEVIKIEQQVLQLSQQLDQLRQQEQQLPEVIKIEQLIDQRWKQIEQLRFFQARQLLLQGIIQDEKKGQEEMLQQQIDQLRQQEQQLPEVIKIEQQVLQLSQQLDQLRQQEQQLPEVIKIEQQIAQLRQQINSLSA